MHSNLSDCKSIDEINHQIQVLKQKLNTCLDEMAIPTCPSELEQQEKQLQHMTRALSDWTMAATVQAALNSDALREEAKALVKRQPGRFKHVGWRKVPVRFSGGATIPLRVAYYARNCDLAKGKKGLTPGLLLLGVHDRCTPLLASQVSLASAALCSLEEAKHMLGNQGCHLDIKTIRNMTKRFACRARLAQEQGNDLPTLENAAVKGRRVVVSVDGGRIRIRKKKRGPKTAKGRSRYKTDWKEPKLLIVYVVNDERRQDKKFCPLIDGTLDGPDALFGLLAYYLEKLGITAADKLLFVADGALWIWDRVIPVLTSVGLAADQILELVDFYHAVEHLEALAKLRSGWSKSEREAWVKKNRRRLKEAQIDEVIDSIDSVCRGTRNTLLKRERNYFTKNRQRMQYGQVAAQLLPIGSGAIESAIRRVVNLRLKGACIYWTEESASEMLLLRSYYKAGRWETLKDMANQVA